MKVSRTWLVDITRSSKPLCCEVLPETVLRGQAKGTTEEGEANEEEREEKDGDEEVEDGEPLVVHHLAAPQLGAEERPA